jgi:hypothetical protein
MSLRVTASGLALLHECAYSFRSDVDVPPDAKSAEARRGDAFGARAENAINGTSIVHLVTGLSQEEASRLEAMWAAAGEWIARHRKLGWIAEAAFAWDYQTDRGRQIERTSHRDYSGATPTEVCGTADIVAIEDDAVIIYDWKTHAPGAPETDATHQLEALALFAARAWDYDRARIVTLNVTADRGVEPLEGELLDAFRLIEVGDRIRADVEHIAGATPAPGEHCAGRYCKAVSVCPATTQAMVQLVPDTALVRQDWRYQPVIESPDHLAHMLTIRPLIRKACDQVDAAIEAYVAEGSVRTSDGREIKKAWRTMPRMNQQALIELARAKGATDDEVNSCVRSSVEGNGVRISGGKRGRAA